MKTTPFDITLADVLFLVGSKLRTGEIVIESGNNIGTVTIHGGKILQAISPYSRSIGDMLVDDGLINEEDLLETLKLQKQNAHIPFGGLLLKLGKVTFEVIEMMVQEQIRKAMKDFTSWTDPTFSFVDKDLKPYDRISLGVQEFIPQAFLESAKAFFTGEPASVRSTQAETR